MSSSSLTSRERMHRMLERRDHDRIPRHDGYWPETIKRWQGEGLQGDAGEVYRLLQHDVTGACWSWPVPFPGRHEVLEEDERTVVVRGNMGKVERLWKDRSGTPEHIRFDCDSRPRWETVYKPALLQAGLSIDPQAAARQSADARQQGLFITLCGIESFEAIRQLMGDEITLAAMASEPEWVRDLSTTYTDLILRDFQAVLDGGAEADAVWVFGDVGYNHGTFFSPAMYRDLIWPDHCRICDWAHEHGMKFIYHTDGDVRVFLDLFAEGGWDCIQPMEAKAGMDVRALAPRYGGCFSFFGNIDMRIAGSNDRERVEEEVKSKLAAGMACRGYAYHSDHSVPPTVSWETYRFIIELVEQYGNYD